MHYSDLIIISFLFFWSFRGFIKGFISELISLLSWATAIYIFIYNFELPLYYIENIIGTSQISSILTIFIIILATYIFSAIIGFFLSKLVLLIGFSTFNKVFGLLFGFLKGLLFILFLIILVDNIGIKNYDFMEQSEIMPYFNYFLDKFIKTSDSLFDSLVLKI